MKEQRAWKAARGLLSATVLVIFVSAGLAGAAERFLTSLERELSDLFEQTKESVVTVRTAPPLPVVEGHELLFFGHPWPGAVASGVVLNAEGYILTTSGISKVTGGDVKVVLSDGRELDGEVIGSDPLSDIAVVKLEAGSPRPAVFGNSDRIRAGSWIIVLGNSFGVSPSITFGMVNAVRNDGLFQVSASVSPGSGGSPVFNSAGEVIGILNASLSDPLTLSLGGESGKDELRVLNMPSRVSSLVTPINNVLEVADELIAHGRVERGWLGIAMQDLDEELKEGLGVENGIIVKRVVESSPAEEAGLEVGDVIVGYDGQAVESTSDFRRMVMGTSPGKRVTIEVKRDGETKRLRVNVTSRAEKAVSLQEWPDVLSLYDKEWREQLRAGAEKLKEAEGKLHEAERKLDVDLRVEIRRLEQKLQELAKELKRLEQEKK
jgi:S1-C subfamily serine protease